MKIKSKVHKNIPKNKGIKTKAKGINVLNDSSKVSEFVIQYKLDIKYPNPNIQPIQNDDNLPKCLLDIR